MTPEEQNRMQRIAQVVEAYAAHGLSVQIEETDNWQGLSGTQIYHMQRRGNLPPHYSYKVIPFSKEGEECHIQ